MNRYDQAELLTALWKIGAVDEPLPTSHGILDRALKECGDDLPAELRGVLTFGVTSVGLRCYELPGILLAAQEALLTSEPNPTYLCSIVTLDRDIARQIVLSHDLSTAKAAEIGQRLLAAVERIRNSSATVEPVAA